MKSFAVCALLTAFGLSQAQTIFYGGDPDGRNGLVSGYNLVSSGEGWVYDNFNIGNQTIGGIFGDWYVGGAYTTSSFTTANYEIRSGITPTNNGGTLVASGTVSVSATDTGLTNFGLKIFRITSGAVSIPLTAGMYWVGMAPQGNGTQSIYVTTANGTVGEGTQNGVGSPLADGNSYFDARSVYGPAGWNPTTTVLGAGTWDFSYGLTAASVPEPASMAILGVGALALIRRRRSKKA